MDAVIGTGTAAARAYVEHLEALIGAPIVLVSVGPGRGQDLQLANPFGE